jgi:hypothetical protein
LTGARPGKTPLGADNDVRSGCVSSPAKLDDGHVAILAEWTRKLDAACERRKQPRQAARQSGLDGQLRVATIETQIGWFAQITPTSRRQFSCSR